MGIPVEGAHPKDSMEQSRRSGDDTPRCVRGEGRVRVLDAGHTTRANLHERRVSAERSASTVQAGGAERTESADTSFSVMSSRMT